MILHIEYSDGNIQTFELNQGITEVQLGNIVIYRESEHGPIVPTQQTRDLDQRINDLNKHLDRRNEQLDTQKDLIDKQNVRIKEQNELLDQQRQVIDEQRDKLNRPVDVETPLVAYERQDERQQQRLLQCYGTIEILQKALNSFCDAATEKNLDPKEVAAYLADRYK